MVGARASCALEGEIVASEVGEGSLSSARARDPLRPAVALADRVRGRVLRACMPWSSRLAADREARVAVVATATVLLSFALTLVSPLLLLALGPIVLGVPHLVADVRYCVVRPGWHRDRGLWLAAVPVVAVGFGAPVAVGLAGVGVAIVTARASTARRLVGLALLGGLVLVAASVGRWFDVALTHLHNAIAVALWLAWRPRMRRWHLVPLALLVGCTAVLVVWPRVDGFVALDLGVPLRSHFAQLAPGVPTALALPLVVSFAFLQSVHYALWLRVVPEEDRERPTPRTFRASLVALDRDLGRPIVRLALVAALALATWAAIDLFAARLGYLRFARFHAVLELCVLARLLVERRTMTSRRDGGLDPGVRR